jgi:sugar-specific transcriptional regulator TrmB
MDSDLIKILKNLGFTEYEAKAYLALLEKSPQTGYGVALNSGVPRSKIYEVLDGLVKNGEVILSYGAPILYAPLPPKELIKHRRKKAESDLNAAFISLEHFLDNTEERDNIWNITGREEILSKANELIKIAEKEVLIELWEDEVEPVLSALNEAVIKGIKIDIIIYGSINFESANIYQFPIDRLEIEDENNRCISICVDKREALQGIVSLGSKSIIANSKHPGLVIPVYEHIKRSIMMSSI